MAMLHSVNTGWQNRPVSQFSQAGQAFAALANNGNANSSGSTGSERHRHSHTSAKQGAKAAHGRRTPVQRDTAFFVGRDTSSVFPGAGFPGPDLGRGNWSNWVDWDAATGLGEGFDAPQYAGTGFNASPAREPESFADVYRSFLDGFSGNRAAYDCAW